MRFILSYMKKLGPFIALTVLIKFTATFLELLIPYVLEFIIDEIAPRKSLPLVLAWGLVMVLLALVVRFFNRKANFSFREPIRRCCLKSVCKVTDI